MLRQAAGVALLVLLWCVPGCDRGQQEQLAQLRAELEEQRTRNESLVGRAEDLLGEIASLEEHRDGLAAEKDALSGRLAEAEEAGELQTERLEALEQQLARLRKDQPDGGEADGPAALEDLQQRTDLTRRRMEQLAALLFARGDLNVARSVALSSFQLGSDVPQTLYQIAFCEAAAGDYEAAADWYRRTLNALDAAPDDELRKKALNNYGVVLAELAEHQKAAEAYRGALAIDAAYAPAHFNLGLLYANELDQPEEAVEAFQKHIVNGGTRGVSARSLILKLQTAEEKRAARRERQPEEGE